MKFRRIAALCVLLAIVPATTAGCADLQKVLQDATTDIASVTTYADMFEKLAVSAWAVILPLIGADARPTADQTFQKALSTLQHSVILANDAITTARAATTQPGDVSALIGAISEAVGQIEGIIAQFQTTSGATRASAQLDDLVHVAGVIRTWRR